MCLCTSVPAAAQQWEAMAQNGRYGVARIETGGPIRGLAVTCEGRVPVLALRPAVAIRSPAVVVLRAGPRAAQVAVRRNGATAIWFAPLRDRSVLDLLASDAPAVSITIDGRAVATLPLAQSAVAFRTALGGCYATVVAAAAPPAPGPAASAPVTLAATDTAAITRAVTQVYHVNFGGATAQPAYSPGYSATRKMCSDMQDLAEKRGLADDVFGACGEDASPICQCQDVDEAQLLRTLRVSARQTAPGTAHAEARFSLFAGSPATTVNWRLVRTSAGWVIDDIVQPGGAGTFSSADRAGMETGIAMMRTKMKLPRWTPPAPTTPAS